jgi:riboflavin kinase
LKTIILTGRVISGVGGGKNFLDSPLVKTEIERKLGFAPFSGTLNVKLDPRSALLRLELHSDLEDKVQPAVGLFPGILTEASIGPYKCAIAHPDDPYYKTDILEIIAPVNLREKLGLSNGSEVTIMVNTP